jgi:hypothetical protein
MLSYSLNDIETIRTGLTDYSLNEETINIINGLINKLGIDVNAVKNKNIKKDKSPLDNAKWAKKEKFKTTVIEKKEGIEERLDEFRCQLNKLSLTNYDEKKEDIIEYVGKLLSEYSSEEQDIINKLLNRFYIVIQNNRFFSKLYAGLFNLLQDSYIELEEKNDFFLENSRDLITRFEYCSPDDDYDKFCDINQTNDMRKAVICFIINLIQEDVYPIATMLEILHDMFDKIDTNKDSRDELEKNEERMETVFTIMSEGKELILKDISKYSLLEKVKEYSIMKTGDYHGYSSRMKFKCMDLVDMYKN